MSDDAAEADIRRGERARVFLEEAIFTEAWAELEAMLTASWRKSPASNNEEREEAYRTLRAMDGLQNVLNGYIQSGIVSRHMIDQAARDKAVMGQ